MHPPAKWLLQPVRNGEWLNVVESKAALSATAIHRKSARRRPKGWAWGGEARGFFDRGAEGAPVRAAAEGSLPLVKPQGNLIQVLVREVRRQGN